MLSLSIAFECLFQATDKDYMLHIYDNPKSGYQL